MQEGCKNQGLVWVLGFVDCDMFAQGCVSVFSGPCSAFVLRKCVSAHLYSSIGIMHIYILHIYMYMYIRLLVRVTA